MYETGHIWLNLGCALIFNPSSVLGETEVTPVLPPLPHVGLAGSFNCLLDSSVRVWKTFHNWNQKLNDSPKINSLLNGGPCNLVIKWIQWLLTFVECSLNSPSLEVALCPHCAQFQFCEVKTRVFVLSWRKQMLFLSQVSNCRFLNYPVKLVSGHWAQR